MPDDTSTTDGTTTSRRFPIDTDEIVNKFEEFWEGYSGKEYYTMGGLADIWEGRTSDGMGVLNGDSYRNYVIAIVSHNDRIFVVQGLGSDTLIKVISPSGIEIYNIGMSVFMIKDMTYGLYGTACAISSYELIIGPMYINLLRQYASSFGADIANFYASRNKAANVRMSSSSWIHGFRDENKQWNIFLIGKASPEDCFDCETKKKIAKDVVDFECIEEKMSQFNRDFKFSLKANRDEMNNGGIPSYARSGGQSKYSTISKPTSDSLECINSINSYISVFNRKTRNASDIGAAGFAISENCSDPIMRSMIEIISYKEDSSRVYSDYIEKAITREPGSNQWLLDECKKIVSKIYPVLSDLFTDSDDTAYMDAMFRDQVWWAPIWFIANSSEVESEEDGNAYMLVQSVSREEFIDTMTEASKTEDPISQAVPSNMGWVITGRKGTVPRKFSSNSATFYSAPYGLCFSVDLLCTILPADDAWSICGVESRSNGIYLWVWIVDHIEWNSHYIACYKVIDGNKVVLVDKSEIPENMRLIENSPASVGTVSDENGPTDFIYRDFYLKDSSTIGFTEVKVKINLDMRAVLTSDSVKQYTNIDERQWQTVLGRYMPVGGAEGSMDTDWHTPDLDDSTCFVDDTRGYENWEGTFSNLGATIYRDLAEIK